ncbi:MAG: malectin domain-containing carbohydrate-binding protein [Cyclobacteriaceae bacterium]
MLTKPVQFLLSLSIRLSRQLCYSCCLLIILSYPVCAQLLPTEFQKVELLTELKNSINFEFSPDGRVFIIDRFGELLVYNPETKVTVSAATLNVFHGLEDGLLAVEFDKDFLTNQYLYLHYSPADTSVNRVSRFTMNGNTLDLNTEVVVIEWQTQRDGCCHSSGDMDMDSEGNLYIATGDNAYHTSANAGYTPLDETNPAKSAEKSSSNTNDLRGKILRIKPEPDGSYSIPEGNLFPNGGNSRPEIYIMGARNPFKIFVDKDNTDWLFWSDVGPDANNASELGPVGYDELNLSKLAGNYGWPYFAGENEPYQNYYSEPKFYWDPDNPVNNSVWNTGETNLPPAKPSWIHFNSKCYLVGQRYYFDPAIENPKKLPLSFDGAFIYFDFNSSQVWAVRLDEEGNELSTEQLNPDVFTGSGLIDMKIGPDGQLYGLEYGEGCCPQNAGTGKLVRFDYIGQGGNRSPVVDLSVDQTTGSLPLTVSFSSDGTFDEDNDVLTYSWDFDSDGTVDSNEKNPTHTYTTEGVYNALLKVDDGTGNVVSKTVTIHAGNNAADFVFNHPPDGGFFQWNDHLEYDIEVVDVEDGSTEDGSIDCSSLNVTPSLGHLDHFHDGLAINECNGMLPFAIKGHDSEGQDDVFYVLNFNYVDKDGLRAFDQITLHPKIKEAEFYDQQYNTQLVSNSDMLGGGNSAVRASADGSYIVFEGRNLYNINSVAYRVASQLGGTIELRLDSPTGTLLNTVNVPNTGSLEDWVTVESTLADPGGKHDLYFIFKNPGQTNLLDLNYIEFKGAGISINDTPPELASLGVLAPDLVRVKFSEPLDKVSAETTANYTISDGLSVSSAALQDDGRTVFLTLAQPLGNMLHKLSINAVKNVEGVAISEAITTDLRNSNKTALFRINAGGDAYELNGVQWMADQYFEGGKTYQDNGVLIDNTSIGEIYLSERWNNFSYEIPVDSGVYDVNLHFAEIFHGVRNDKGEGARLFNVDIESGQATLDNYDIYASAGGSSTAVVESFTGIEVTDGKLSISFEDVAQNAKISGIEVFRGVTSSEPSVSILKPSDNAEVIQPFQLEFLIQNWDVGQGTTHFHLFVDGENQGGVYSTDPITFSDLSPGIHTLELRLMNVNHSPTEYSDQITIRVLETGDCIEQPFPDQWLSQAIGEELPYRSVYIYAEDMDGDNLKDIVTGGWWYKNPGDIGGEWVRSTIGAPMNNMSLIFDIDGDGDLDIFGTQGEYVGAKMAWAENDGSGNFTIHTNIPDGTSTFKETFMAGAVVADFEGDDGLEIVFTWNGGDGGNSSVQMLSIPDDPVNEEWTIKNISEDSYGEAISAGDLDGDGDLDLFQAGNWLRNDNGTWTTFSTGVNLPSKFDRNHLADIDGDGDLDAIVTLIGSDQEVYWLKAPADPTQNWTAEAIGSNVDGALSLDVKDIDFDGDQDVIVGEISGEKRLIVFENDLCASGQWVERVLDANASFDHHDGAQLVDLDNDSDYDVISIGWGNITPRIFVNNSDIPKIPEKFEVIYRENAGGEKIASQEAEMVDWSADTNSEPSAYRQNGAIASVDEAVTLDSSVPEGVPMEIFQTERFWLNAESGGASMRWSVPVTAGETVQVRFYLAETNFSSADRRVFDILLDGETVENDLDMFAEAGKNTGFMRSFNLVSDGAVDISFKPEVENPAIKGFEIISLGETVVVDAGNDQKLVLPEDSTTLTAKVFSGIGDISYAWEQVSGPSEAQLEGGLTSELKVASLQAGEYVFKVTVSDEDGSIASDDVKVRVSNNKAPALLMSMPDLGVITGAADVVIDLRNFFKDEEEPFANLNISASSDNTDIVATSVSEGVLTLTFAETLTGITSVTVEVADQQGETTSETFGVQVYQEDDNFIYRENTGGNQLVSDSADKPFWNADTNLNPSIYRSEGSIAVTESQISLDASVPEGVPMEVFQTERFWRNAASGGAPMSWTVPVDSGEIVQVRFFLAETYFTAKGLRVFDILLDGETVEDDLDMFAEAGKNTGFMRSFSLVSDGAVDISFKPEVENPAIKGFEIISLGETVVVDAGNDQKLVLPEDSTTLTAKVFSGIGDISYAWEQVSGPSEAQLEGGLTSELKVASLQAGEYVFKVTVTDEIGVTATDEVMVKVNSDNAPVLLTDLPDVGVGLGSKSVSIDLRNYFEDSEELFASLVINATSDDTDIVSTSVSEGILTLNFVEAALGITSVTVEVTDQQGGQISETFFVQIYELGEDFMYRENVGGKLLISDSVDKPFWNADTDEVPSPYRKGGSILTTTSEQTIQKHSSVPENTPMDLFLTKRSETGENENKLAWSIPIEEGMPLNLRVYLIENEYEEAGKRIFDIIADDQVLEADIDIFEEAGYHTAMMKSYELQSDGVLDIDFDAKDGSPLVAGIEVLKSGHVTQIGDNLNEIISVYPNPFSNEIFVETNTTINPEELNFDIFTVDGRKINISPSDIMINDNIISINMDRYSLSDGLFYMTIYNKDGKKFFNGKIIKG